MCYGCYEEAGRPLPEGTAKELGDRLREVNGFGGCHIVVSDWNLDDDSIDFCITYPTTTDAEKKIMIEMKSLPEDQRYAAMAVACDYIDRKQDFATEGRS